MAKPTWVNPQITDSITQTRHDQAVVDAMASGDLGAISTRLTALLGQINARLTQGALQARSSVDVLTDNALADEIASLRAALDALDAAKSGGRKR